VPGCKWAGVGCGGVELRQAQGVGSGTVGYCTRSGIMIGVDVGRVGFLDKKFVFTIRGFCYQQLSHLVTIQVYTIKPTCDDRSHTVRPTASCFILFVHTALLPRGDRIAHYSP